MLDGLSDRRSKAVLALYPRGEPMQRLVLGLLRATSVSFKERPMRNKENPTKAEVRRRSGMALDIALQLRGDMQWGIQRVMDHLPQYLLAELDGVPWRPDERKIWIPADGAV